MDGSDEPPGMGKSLGSCSRATVATLGLPMQSSNKDPALTFCTAYVLEGENPILNTPVDRAVEAG